ncbi:DUF3793 family protein [Anaerolentibacter hominis]|uniref:DUF3793 family protein n=1 Tax=Anaerolentibacter hominis TaxID=3079009 RepID=UPI0031B88C1D
MLLEKYLIEHCSPTLASLKTANLFCVTAGPRLEQQIEAWNTEFKRKGLFLMKLGRQGTKELIYLCRKSRLEADLKKPGVARFLRDYGYQDNGAEYALGRLKNRLGEMEDFPHEIGIFLGYPLGDVIGFIRNAGKNSKCTGCWKVYCNECEALKQFERFKKCREVYIRLWNQGRSIRQLTVAV